MRCLIYCMRDVMHDALTCYENEWKIQRVPVIPANSHRTFSNVLFYLLHFNAPALAEGRCKAAACISASSSINDEVAVSGNRWRRKTTKK